MKLSELTYHDGAPAEIEEGMAIRYLLHNDTVEYGVVGMLRPSDGAGNTVCDIGCGCCCESYRITGWAWLVGADLLRETIAPVHNMAAMEQLDGSKRRAKRLIDLLGRITKAVS